MALHFTPEELKSRRDRACAAVQKAGLDGMLLFRQESMYYLTGYDTFGYVFFQCLYLGADGRMTLLTRAPDLPAGAAHLGHRGHPHLGRPRRTPSRPRRCATSSPSIGCRGKRLGVEWEAYGLTARNGQRADAALDGFCTLDRRLRSRQPTAGRQERRPNSPLCARAAELADAALAEAWRLAKPGAFEGDILAAMQGAVFRGGGDDPGNEYIIGSGPTRCSAATSPAGGISTLTTSSRSNSPASIATTMHA